MPISNSREELDVLGEREIWWKKSQWRHEARKKVTGA